jgi:hypothetical protein
MLDRKCPKCGLSTANDRQYWYAMGRLHDRRHGPDNGDLLRAEDLEEVFSPNYCWVDITAMYDGPNELEYTFSHAACVKRVS